LDASEAFAGQDVQFDADERPDGGIEDAVRGGGAGEAVREVAPRVVDALDLSVLAERVSHLQVAGFDLGAHGTGVEKRCVG
jgi:hypothetical protein